MISRFLGILAVTVVVGTGMSWAQEPAAAGSLSPEIVSEKPKPTVNFAKSWDAAVEEARLLNLPIIIHSHGFY